jgi:Tol biopolymer transport system component
VPLGHFHSPPEYDGEFRCDTHPRFSPDGRKVVIDSPHGGNGRQMYLFDVGAIAG